jgi:protein TonB
VTDEPLDTTQGLLGKPIKVVRPDYPKFAMLSHIEGDVVVELKVNPNGRVQNVRTISGKPILAAAAEDAAREFQYLPFTAKHVPAVTQVRFNFKLHTDDKK